MWIQRAIQELRNAVGGVKFPTKKRYDDVQFNVISDTRGWVCVKFPVKKHYVTLEPKTYNSIYKTTLHKSQ